MARVNAFARPSDSTLAQLPARALTFLNAIATRPAIRALLFDAGFRRDDHEEGWRLLQAVGALLPGALTAPSRATARTANDELCAWVGANFRRYQAAMTRLHPAWVPLFPDTNARSPADCLLVMATLTEGLRQGQASHDEELRGTLAQRGLTTDELARLSTLVATAQRAAELTTDDGERDARTEELVALYHWYRDWAESAKRFVKRRDYLTQLGISRRQEE
jgi:hypothetical protein